MEQSICIFGASSTQGFYDTEKGGWPDRLKMFLYEKALRTGDYFEVFNLGISGNTSKDLLARFEKDSESRHPSVVIISLGDNDSALGIPIEDYERNMDKILTQAKQFTKNIIALGAKKVNEKLTTPVPWRTDISYLNSEIKRYDERLKGLAKKHEVEYVSFYDVLDEKDLQDGLHPNSEGHRKIFEIVKGVLQKKGLI
jgi:lysophospholipase L1-like esterase